MCPVVGTANTFNAFGDAGDTLYGVRWRKNP